MTFCIIAINPINTSNKFTIETECSVTPVFISQSGIIVHVSSISIILKENTNSSGGIMRKLSHASIENSIRNTYVTSA